MSWLGCSAPLLPAHLGPNIDFLGKRVPKQSAWNEQLWSQTFQLVQEVASFRQHHSYAESIRDLLDLKEDIDSDPILAMNLHWLDEDAKVNYLRPLKGYVVKKRPESNISELFFWELAIILSLDAYVAPSYPIAFGKNRIIVQRLQELRQGTRELDFPRDQVANVSLEDYWKSHILAFLLGSEDLSGVNLGIMSQGKVYFFDNENSLGKWSSPKKEGYKLWVPFASVGFDWPQYRNGIDSSVLAELQSWIASLEDRTDEILLYSQIRGCDVRPALERIEMLKKFPLSEGVTFCDFVAFLYPDFADGLDELNQIVADIAQVQVDHGRALFYCMYLIERKELSAEAKARMSRWLNTYFP